MAADKKRIKIGFLGMGTVGQGVWKHLLESRDRMTARMGVEYYLGPVGVRGIAKKRSVEIPRNLLTDNLAEIVEDPQVDIVCELMGGTSDALNLTLRALERGKTVVSANKALICEHGSEIFAAARANGGRYFFEAFLTYEKGFFIEKQIAKKREEAGRLRPIRHLQYRQSKSQARSCPRFSCWIPMSCCTITVPCTSSRITIS